MEKTKKFRIFNCYFCIITLIYFVYGISNFFYNSTFAIYLKTVFGDGAGTKTGVLMACFTISATVFRLVGGKISDTKGRRRVVIVGLVIFALGCVLMWPARTVALFCLARILQGCGFAIAGTALSAAVADVIPRERMGEGIGYYGLANSLTQAIAPTIALAVYNSSAVHGWRNIVLASLGGLAMCVVLALFVTYEHKPDFPGNRIEAIEKAKSARAAREKKSLGQSLAGFFEKKALPFGMVQFFVSFAYGVIMVFLTDFGTEQGFAHVGWYFTIAAVTTFLGRLLTGRISDRHNPLVVLIPGFAAGVLGFLLLVACPKMELLYYVSAVFIGAFNGVTGPTLNASALKASPADRKGAASATYQVPVEIAFALSSMICGAIYDATHSYSPTFIVSAVSSGVAILLSVIVYRKRH